MGMFDWLTGTKRPATNTPPKPPQEVRQALLAINRPTAPFVIRDGAPEQCDLVAEWRIVDAAWYGIFGKAGLTKVYRILMRMDPAKNEVRALDEAWDVEWANGIPSLSRSYQRGQISQSSYGKGYAFTEQGPFGQVYNYRFNTSELKPPLKDAVTAAGWTWRGVSFGKL
jgi:hypothetical protein